MEPYANPGSLVSTEWAADHLEDPEVVFVEVNVDTSLYDTGHIPGAIGWDWTTQLADPIRRDLLSRADLERLLSESGIGCGMTVVLYGDHNNWFAAWAFWQLAMHGHSHLRLLNGGRKKWIAEGRPLSRGRVSRTPTSYRAAEPDQSMRALLRDVQRHLGNGAWQLVDVRSPEEFSGEILAPPGLPETCQRGGHIPGARNIPWSMAINEEDGTFKSSDELRDVYGQAGITGDNPVITYCRIGERSSHTWFVLRYLLGFPHVLNYDGSWTEWGNLVGAPVGRGA